MIRLFFALIFGICLTAKFAQTACAQNTGGVFGPIVNDGHKSLQYRITVDPDDTNGQTGIAQRLHYQQALDGKLMWRIVGQARKTAASDIDFDFVQAELFWQITEDDSSYQTGLRFDARYRGDDRPEQFGVNWMNQFQLGHGWQARAILLTAVQTGDNSADGIFLQTRGNLYRKLDDGQTVGLEMYNNYGNSKGFGSFKRQAHTIGPFVSVPVGGKISLYGGAQFGLSESAADTELRLWITKGF